MVDLELGEFLYDLEEDPGGRTSMKEKHPEILNKLKTIHKMWRESLGK